VSQSTINAGNNQAVCDLTPTLNLSGNNSANAPVQWISNGNGTITSINSLQTTYSLNPFDAVFGTIVFTLSSISNSICPLIGDTVMMRVLKQTTVSVGPDLDICSDQVQINLNGSITGESTTGVWTSNGSGLINAVNPGSYTTSAGDIQNGSVVFILNSTNNITCPSVSDTLEVKIRTAPVLFVGDDSTFCFKGAPFYLNPNIQNGGNSYVWTSTGNGKFLPSNTSFTATYMPGSSDIAAGQVLLALNSVNNGACGNVSADIKLFLRPSPLAKFSVSSTTITLPTTNTVQLTNQSTSSGTFTWNFGNGGTSNNTNPLVTYNEVGNYSITLIAENEYECSDTATQVVLVVSEVRFPNAFTPNTNGPSGGSYNSGDQSNDIFYPFTGGVTEYELMIFNRWGEQIFLSNDIKIGWDGYFNGKPCQQDVYVWKANMTFFDGRKYSQTGTVTLLR
jgi:gliding motility-associated-like protein